MRQDTPDTLLILQAPDVATIGRSFSLSQAPNVITIGRSADNTLPIASVAVSRLHARLEKRAEGWWVTDAGSSQGTLVNGMRIDAICLKHGDRIQLGDTILKVECASLSQRTLETRHDPTAADGLTSLLTRAQLMAQLPGGLTYVSPAHPLCLVWVDIDQLGPKVNAPYGHPVGDGVIREVAQRARRHARPGRDLLARMGGEEFVFALPGTTRMQASALAQALRAEVAAHPIAVSGHSIATSITASVVETQDPSCTADALIQRALEALQQAKARL